MQTIPGTTVKRDVERKTKNLLQSPNYTAYSTDAHKIVKCRNKVEPSRELAMLPGSLPGHSRRMHGGRTKFSPGETGVSRRCLSAGTAGRWQEPAPMPQGQKLLNAKCSN